MKQLPNTQYEFKATEEKILAFWKSKPFFKAEYEPVTDKLLTLEELKADPRTPWSLICPPPNAYDRPHMGNLSGYPYQDALARYHRALGKKVYVNPGKDHAGIEGEATYVKYFLEKEGKSKFDFSREDFYQKVYEWQKDLIPKIQKDEQEVGLSADFDRDLYTLDDKVVEEVLSTFTRMYQDGLIYKGVRLVNWDPKTRTAISDSQCEREERQGKLYYISYPIVGSNESLVVATTRPETMLGDTALVVNPEDERYAHLVGKTVRVPLTEREIPVITSYRIEKEFGTGVLKLTPSHANEDYEIMNEWNAQVEELTRDNTPIIENLPQKVSYINVIGKDLKMCGDIPEKYKGIKVNAAKELIIEDLRTEGHLQKEEPVTQNVLISERSGAVVEPLMSSQWFVDVSGFKQALIDMVATGEVKLFPKYSEKKYFAWVKNLRDWAISRNLWWGYRLPVWYKGELLEKIDEKGLVANYLKINGEEVLLDPQNPEHMRVQIECPGEEWIQDEDILDTWFSSGQWPYLCLKTNGLMDTFYPTDTLVSGYDLLIKWDLTMMLFSYYQTGKPPFKNLYLTGLVKGTDGQKMSKSKRNFVAIDEVKDMYGMDSFRMNCFYQNKAGKSYAITSESLKNFRNFNNKIWNASKFVMMNLEDLDRNELSQKVENASTVEEIKALKLSFADYDLDMLAHLEEMEQKFTKHFESFKFGLLTETLYSSFWHTFCDIYIEKAKARVWKNKDTGQYSVDEDLRFATQAVLFYSLKAYLKMLHPFIPFITEEIWQHLVEDGKYTQALMHRVGSTNLKK